MKPWLIRRKLLMAQAKDLQRQLQEAWDKNKALEIDNIDLTNDWYAEHMKAKSIQKQLHRVARERDECYRQQRLADIRRQKLILSQLEEDNG